MNLISQDGRLVAVPLDGIDGGEHTARLLACVGVLLSRYTDRTEFELVLQPDGDSARRLVKLDLAGDPNFADVVGRVRQAVTAADENGHADNGETPPDGVLSLEAGAPELTLRQNSTLPVDEFPGHLRTMLAAVEHDGERPISAVSITTDEERTRLLDEWNQTAAPYPRACLHELAQEQARRTPGRVAIECGSERLTYGELDARSSQLANYLVSRGVGPEILVGICVERSPEMLVGLFGILKAGGAYVPIDPAYPAERQAFMLESSEAPIVLTQERLIDRLPAGEFSITCLDRDLPAISRQPTDAPADNGDTEKLAYVIYTSGSTGKPKGVQIPHRALVNFLCAVRERPGLGADDVLVAVTTLSFDIAGLELYLPLLVGGQIVLARQETTDARALAALMDSSGATVMQATPTTWRMLIDSGWKGRPGLRALCGGEALPRSLSDALVDLGIELWNMYGPTETTIWSTCKHVDSLGRSVTIGRPIANTTIYILDGHMQPVPVGVAGELWIGGDGLARGYRGRPDLTEERFVAHPFSDTPGARIYRTGDLARYQPDGEIEFLGRIDHQVKVRGFRIELGEIENTLTRHPAVSEAVVIARGRESTEAELAAYVVPTGVPVSGNVLRRFATQTLPAYMVPSTVTMLDSFPLTPNGKIDRKALPEPDRERSSEEGLVAPRTEMERRLAEIWTRELGIEAIGVTDDFFDLGVTSVMAATLFAAIEHVLGRNLPLGAIFQAPTIESLAKMLEGGRAKSRWTSLVPIQPEGSQPAIFCIHGGAGTILHLAPLARRLGTDQPFYGLQSRGLYGGSTPLKTVEEMADHYLSEMRQVHEGGPWRLAGYCFGTIVAFELANRLVAAGEQVELVAFFNGPSPSWIRQWRWYGNQPSWRARNPVPERPTAQEVRRREISSVLRRTAKAFREPRRFFTGLKWYLRGPLTRLALALGRPLPEQQREEYFFELHARAERAYEPVPYEGEILVFYGEGLYEDPALGWDGLAAGGIRSFGVPGFHDNNRQAMMEPAVSFVSDRLVEYLS
jgi:amino acid adenylation domain-containing protein